MTPAELAQLWEEHTSHEFSTRDTESTLATMAEDAYVNHVPVLTGGTGKPALRLFYSRDFIPSMPPDTGVGATYRYVEVALVAIVHFRNGKLAHENIYWDQASVLKQIGILAADRLPVFGAESARKVRVGAGRELSAEE